MRLTNLLHPQLILTPLASREQESAVRELLSAIGAARGIDAEAALRDLRGTGQPEENLIRAGDFGLAIRHALTASCKQILLAVGTSRQGLGSGQRGHEQIHAMFLLLAPQQARLLHLRLLSRLARLCTEQELAGRLVESVSPSEVIQHFMEAESDLEEIETGEGMPSFCVIGAGPGGLAMAGHLAMLGCRVNLCTRNPERLEPILARGGIDITGEVQGFVRPNLATTDIAQACRNVDVLMIVVPATAHRNIATLLAPHVSDGQIIVLNPGRTGGALELAQVLKAHGLRSRPFLAEAQTLLYASRLTNPGQVHIYRIKNSVPLATLPAYRVVDILPIIRTALPQFVPGDNILKTSLDNIGAVFHPAITVLNAGRIEDTHGDFEYYTQGVTPAVAELLEAIDHERVAVASALGIRANTAREWLYLAYNAAGRTLLEAMRANPGYSGIKAPATVQHRYIWEDVPTSLVPIASLGQMLGVPTPTIRAIIHVASIMHGVDYWGEGRTVERLGLAGMSVKEIQLLVVGAEVGTAGPPSPPDQPWLQTVTHDG